MSLLLAQEVGYAEPLQADTAGGPRRHLHPDLLGSRAASAPASSASASTARPCAPPGMGGRPVLRGQRRLGLQRQAPAGLRADAVGDRRGRHRTPSSPGTTTDCTARPRSWRPSSTSWSALGSGSRWSTGGDYDLTTPEGRFTARIVGAVARKESEDRSRRVRRKHLELAEQGKPAGQLGWGVRNDAERELVREAAQRVLAGQGLMTIARDWNRRGVPGATEHPWTAPTLRKVLLSARDRRPARARCRPVGQGPGRPDAGDLGGGDRPPDVGPRPVGAAQPRAAHPQEHADEVPIDGPDLLRRLRRPHALAPAGRPHQALRLRRPPAGPPARPSSPSPSTTSWPGGCWSCSRHPRSGRRCSASPGGATTESLGQALAELGSAQSRLQTLDDDYYVRGVLAERRYRSIRTKLEREVERLHALVDAASKRRIVLHPDPRSVRGRTPTSASAGSSCGCRRAGDGDARPARRPLRPLTGRGRDPAACAVPAISQKAARVDDPPERSSGRAVEPTTDGPVPANVKARRRGP